jgi:hypothetical protein
MLEVNLSAVDVIGVVSGVVVDVVVDVVEVFVVVEGVESSSAVLYVFLKSV